MSTVRTAWASEAEAIAAARDAVASDRRPRGIWLADGGHGAGCSVPTRWIVGHVKTFNPPSAHRIAVVDLSGVRRGVCDCAGCNERLRKGAL